MLIARSIRVHGIVQGVGFRPTVLRFAKRLGLKGNVLNDGDGVLIHAWGIAEALDQLTDLLRIETPPLARIDEILVEDLSADITPKDFVITSSEMGSPRTIITPDATTCTACIVDTLSPPDRRYRYPFTNCTHCGPRFSIVKTIPYDRKNTSMSSFSMCDACQREYDSPNDRRFHAQPNACHSCGPKVWLEPTSEENADWVDDIDKACEQIKQGKIVAIKGIGGFHLACDASNISAVKRLRKRKRRYQKPFALMAANMKSIRRFCTVSDKEEALLKSSESPIVILQINSQEELPQALAPGQSSLGFMLPYTPLHHLLLQQLDDPIVLTSGNLSDEPQCIDNDDAKKRLSNIADFMLLHNRDILNRVDDSVVRIIANEAVILRRSRGYAPVPLSLPPGFDSAPDALAMGGELKNTFCLIKDAQAIVSQHIGDLEDAPTYQDYLNNIQLYKQMYEHTAERIVIDKHPEYMSSKLGQKTSEKNNVPLDKVQHHHAHIAACMAENAWPLNAGPVLGIALDGLGHGGDTFWGGEFLLVNYADYQRVGSFRPVALLGGSKAMREPWRNTYAHLNIESDWSVLADKYEHLEIIQLLQSKPLATLNAMLQSGANSPLASSCGRLFDAVAAAVGFSAQTTSYEGQAAIEFEAVVDLDTLYHEDDSLSYSFEIVSNEMPFIDSTMMWPEVLEDLSLNTPRGVISARFHKGLAKIIVAMVDKVTSEKKSHDINTIALSGGVFQNRILNEQVITRLREKGYQVLTHHQIPANDGGISFGQAVVSAARAIATFKET